MIAIPAALLDRIKAAAETAYPKECCGLLAGITAANGDITVTRLAESPNVTTGDQHDRFEVDPKVRFELMRDLGGAEVIVGHYHSHPDHPARPSEHDLKMAFEPDLIWVIVAVDAGRVTNAAAFAVDDDNNGFHEIPVNSI